MTVVMMPSVATLPSADRYDFHHNLFRFVFVPWETTFSRVHLYLSTFVSTYYIIVNQRGAIAEKLHISLINSRIHLRISTFQTGIQIIAQ
jgi:hypothetical protein